MTHFRTITTVSTLMLAVGTLGACHEGTTSTPPDTADDNVFRAATQEPDWELEDPSRNVTITYVDGTAPMLELSGFIARICEIPEPKFPFDSSKIKDRHDEHLDALARCMTEGPLKGEDITLVGHADKRGPKPYNMALGQRRAGSVAEYLKDYGVAASRIVTSSMGELKADGTTPEGYQQDRRVDVDVRK